MAITFTDLKWDLRAVAPESDDKAVADDKKETYFT